MNLSQLNLVIGILIGAITILAYVKGVFAWIWEKIKSVISPSSDVIPKKTLILLPLPRDNATWWHMGGVGGKPAMQIVGDIRVTNISRYNILLSACKLKRPKVIGHAHIFSNIGAIEENGEFLIPEQGTCQVRISCWIVPPVKKENQNFVTDLAIIDQFGNEHWMKKVEFRYT